MTQYELKIVENPLGGFHELMSILCDQQRNFDLASGVLDELDELLKQAIRTKDSFERFPGDLEIHFWSVYPLGFRMRGVDFVLLCGIVDQEKKIIHLVDGRLCETDEDAERARKAALDKAKIWAGSSAEESD